MLIGISGKIGSGKDTVCSIIQWLTNPRIHTDPNIVSGEDSIVSYQSFESWQEEWKTKDVWTNKFTRKKYAGILKDFVCLATNCTREQLEDIDFKNQELGPEWNRYVIVSRTGNGMHLKINNYPMYFTSKEEALRVAEDIYPVETIVMTRRLMLQLMGTEAMRDNVHPNFWVNALFASYTPVVEERRGDDNSWMNYPNWIITDMRFPNEMQAIKERGGITIRIQRDVDSSNRPIIRENEHLSETALDNAEFDYIIDNNGDINTLIYLVKEILIKEQIL